MARRTPKLGPATGVVLIGIISLLGFREFLEITEERVHEKPLQVVAYLALLRDPG